MSDNTMTLCPHCQPDTAGNHEDHCPFHPKNAQSVTFLPYGWVCPKCGFVYGPHVDECCRCNPPVTVTWQPWPSPDDTETWPVSTATETPIVSG